MLFRSCLLNQINVRDRTVNMQSCFESVEIVEVCKTILSILYRTSLLPIWKLTGFNVLPEIPIKRILHSRKQMTKRLNTFFSGR